MTLQWVPASASLVEEAVQILRRGVLQDPPERFLSSLSRDLSHPLECQRIRRFHFRFGARLGNRFLEIPAPGKLLGNGPGLFARQIEDQTFLIPVRNAGGARTVHNQVSQFMAQSRFQNPLPFE